MEILQKQLMQGAAGLTSYVLTVPVGQERAIDGTFAFLRCVDASAGFEIDIDGRSLPMDKGMAIRFPSEDGEIIFFKKAVVRNTGAVDLTVKIVGGLGEMLDNRMNFVAGASVLEVETVAGSVAADQSLIVSGGSSGVPYAIAPGGSQVIGSQTNATEQTITNCGVVPLRISRVTLTGRGGTILWPGQTIVRRANHAYAVQNLSSYSGRFFFNTAHPS